MVEGTDLVLKRVAAGFTAVNGLAVRRVDMASDKVPRPQQNMKALGRAACRTATARKHTQMADRIRVSGRRASDTVTVFVRRHRLDWPPTTDRKCCRPQ